MKNNNNLKKAEQKKREIISALALEGLTQTSIAIDAGVSSALVNQVIAGLKRSAKVEYIIKKKTDIDFWKE